MVTMEVLGKNMVEISKVYGSLRNYVVYESNHDSIIVRTWKNMDFDIDENSWKTIKLPY